LDIYLYPQIELNEIEKEQAIVFIFLGQTGSGKTLLLNSFINYVYGIEFKDNFRYEIAHEDSGIPQTETRTSNVIVYNIKATNRFPPFQIIDTPGFVHTKGLKQDMITFSQIEKVFKEKINSLNAICFVTMSSITRFTPVQLYILTSILDLFGEDVKENFIAMLTFSDDGKPQVMEALEDPPLYI
jgi:GTPase SAR1 family protein